MGVSRGGRAKVEGMGAERMMGRGGIGFRGDEAQRSELGSREVEGRGLRRFREGRGNQEGRRAGHTSVKCLLEGTCRKREKTVRESLKKQTENLGKDSPKILAKIAR